MVSGFGANLRFGVWSKSNGIISASSIPTKPFHTTNPNSTKMTPSNPTVSASSATPSNNAVLTNDYLLVVVVLINWRESLTLSHHSLSRKSSLFFQRNRLFPSFSPHQERSMICSPWSACRCSACELVSSGAWWRRRLNELRRWTYSEEWEILFMDGEEREREFEINLWWDYLKERI